MSVYLCFSFPEIEFFNAPSLREQMVLVLFCFARHVEKLSYRQVCLCFINRCAYILKFDTTSLTYNIVVMPFGVVVE